jgi:hypothetical protein
LVRSEIRDPEKLIPDPDPGVKKSLDPGSARLVSVRASFFESSFFLLGKVTRQTSMMSVQEKQLQALEKRQKLFKEAALQVSKASIYIVSNFISDLFLMPHSCCFRPNSKVKRTTRGSI